MASKCNCEGCKLARKRHQIIKRAAKRFGAQLLELSLPTEIDPHMFAGMPEVLGEKKGFDFIDEMPIAPDYVEACEELLRLRLTEKK